MLWIYHLETNPGTSVTTRRILTSLSWAQPKRVHVFTAVFATWLLRLVQSTNRPRQHKCGAKLDRFDCGWLQFLSCPCGPSGLVWSVLVCCDASGRWKQRTRLDTDKIPNVFYFTTQNFIDLCPFVNRHCCCVTAAGIDLSSTGIAIRLVDFPGLCQIFWCEDV